MECICSRVGLLYFLLNHVLSELEAQRKLHLASGWSDGWLVEERGADIADILGEVERSAGNKSLRERWCARRHRLKTRLSARRTSHRWTA